MTFDIPENATVSSCRSCGAPIVWIKTPRGKLMPVEAYGKKKGESHFAHCAQASDWRKK